MHGNLTQTRGTYLSVIHLLTHVELSYPCWSLCDNMLLVAISLRLIQDTIVKTKLSKSQIWLQESELPTRNNTTVSPMSKDATQVCDPYNQFSATKREKLVIQHWKLSISSQNWGACPRLGTIAKTKLLGCDCKWSIQATSTIVVKMQFKSVTYTANFNYLGTLYCFQNRVCIWAPMRGRLVLQHWNLVISSQNWGIYLRLIDLRPSEKN